MSSATPDALPDGQQEALVLLRSIAQASDGALTVDVGYQMLDGLLTVRVYLASASLLPPGRATESEEGIKLEDWEPIDIHIPEDFPNSPPIAWAGRDDFPELPHKAEGSLFCVRVERNNWDSTAGMAGFLRAVIETYERIALGTLQGHLQPWRPTAEHVHYGGNGCAVIRADVPAGHGAGNSLRWAVGRPVSEDRIDVIGWLDVNGTRADAGLTKTLSGQLADIKKETPGAFLIAAVVAAEPMAVEYSEYWDHLLTRLQRQGFERTALLGHLVRAVTVNQLSSGERAQGAVLLRVAADTGPVAEGQDARFAVARLPQDDVGLLLGMRAEGEGTSADEFAAAAVPWVHVYDGRPESVLRRAAGRPTDQLTGARILLLGCGGLGAPIAEHCVRSGAARLHIVDSGTVSPGVLSRQPYEDADIGQHKAAVLAARLARIRPGESEVTGLFADITASDLFAESELGQYNLVIDATANRSVAAVIERAQRDLRSPWPTVITVAISQRATHGVAAVTPRDAVGACIDLLRRLGLRTCMSTALGDVYTAFFPPADERLNFRPDPSCSDTTFIGSATDMGALAAQLLDAALARLDLRPGACSSEPQRRSLSIVRIGNGEELKAARVVLDLPHDRVVMDHSQTYEVRIDETAMEAIREHVRASVNGRTRGAGHTGGLLLGQFDNACRVAWVSRATGLPPESTVDPLNMNLDAPEVSDFLRDRREQSEGMLTLVGFWRTSQGGPAEPSEADQAAMRRLAARPERRSAPALLLELGRLRSGPAGEPASPWPTEIRAETFPAGPDTAPSGEDRT